MTDNGIDEYKDFKNLNTERGRMCLMQNLRSEFYNLERWGNGFIGQDVVDVVDGIAWLRNAIELKFSDIREEDILPRFTEFVDENLVALSNHKKFFANVMYVLLEFVHIKNQDIVEAWLDLFVRAVDENWTCEKLMHGSRFNYGLVNDCKWIIRRDMMPKILKVFPAGANIHDNSFLQGFCNGLDTRSEVRFESCWLDMVSIYMSDDIIYDMIHDKTGAWIGHNILDEHFPITVFNDNVEISKGVFDVMVKYNRWIFNEESDRVYATMKYGAT